MTFQCPKGHDSETPDWCSECGTAIEPASSKSTPGTTVDTCPICSTERTPGGRFCEVCRYDFVEKKPSDPSSFDQEFVTPPAVEATQDSPNPDHFLMAIPAPGNRVKNADAKSGMPRTANGTPINGNLWAVVTADRSLLEGTDDPLFPSGEQQRNYPLDLDENLVGRKGARQNIHPEIPVNDPSVSARHCKICRRKDGSAYVVDVGSTNGTKLNGIALEEGVETAVEPGDEIVVGAWTRVALQVR
jgi:hypothetical protein